MVRGESVADTEEGTLTLVSGVNVRDLPIGPTEAFVLSRIDGQSSQADIAAATGLTAEQVAGIVGRLVALGAAEFRDQRAPGARQPATMRSGAHSIPLVVQAEQAVELSAEQQRQLLEFDQRRSALDHYQLLGVNASDDVKLIRVAYYELVRQYHPDRFFRKQLGSYAGLLLRVFGAFTEAYEVLRRAESRAEYDRYLQARERTLAFDRYFRESPASPASIPPSIPPPGSSVSTLPPPASGTLRRASEAPSSDPDARRRALARKLGHSSVPPKVSSSAPPDSNAASRAAEELKRRYGQRLAQAQDEQRNHYVTLAKEAEARNDLVAAANALRVACSLAPGNLELAGDLAELERRAAAALWEAYVDRAEYAALEGRSAEAAEAYERAALGQPTASLCERAAFYTLEAGGDLKRASRLAKQAVSIAPHSARCRLTLAQVYAAAKLRDSALAELERARALDPNQPLIKEWIQRVKRGDI